MRTRIKNPLQAMVFMAIAITALALSSGSCKANQIVKFQLYNTVLSDGSVAVGAFDYDFTTNRASNISLSIGNGVFDNSASAPTSISRQNIHGSYKSAATENELAFTFASTLDPVKGAALSLNASASYLIEDTTVGLNDAGSVTTLTLTSGSVLPVVYLPITTAALSGPSAPAQGWFEGTVTVTLTAIAGAHPVSATYYTLDSGTATKYTGPFQVSGEAVHTLTYWSVDASGLAETAHNATVAIDAAPPVTSVSQYGEKVTLSAMDAVSGVAATYYAVNGGPQQTYSLPFIAPVGTDVAVYWSVDNAGNAETAQTLSFVAGDTVPPTAPGSPYFAVQSAAGGTMLWTASTDNVGVVGYIIEYYHGHSGRGGGYSWSPIGTTSGTFFTVNSFYLGYSLAVLAYDAAGNKSPLSGVPSAVPPSVLVNGLVSLEGITDLSQTAVPLDMVTVEFRAPGSTVTLNTQTVPISVSVAGGSTPGMFSVSFPPGTYDVSLKTPKNLKSVVFGAVISGASTSLPAVTLAAGDANNDNNVDVTDFGLLVGAYGSDFNITGSGYDASADFNSDGRVDVTDFGLLVGNYGSQGGL